MFNTLTNKLKNFLNKIEIINLIYSSSSTLKHVMEIHQFDIFAWIMANLVISYLTTFWIQLFIPGVYISSKELLNTAFVIFVNASLFSILPNIIIKKNQQLGDNEDTEDAEDTENIKIEIFKSIADLLKYFNVLSTTIAIIIPFIYTTLNFSFLVNSFLTTILLILSFIHFLFQHCYKEIQDNFKLFLDRPKLAEDNEPLPEQSQYGGRVG